jgi:hypothetical protein
VLAGFYFFFAHVNNCLHPVCFLVVLGPPVAILVLGLRFRQPSRMVNLMGRAR